MRPVFTKEPAFKNDKGTGRRQMAARAKQRAAYGLLALAVAVKVASSAPSQGAVHV